MLTGEEAEELGLNDESGECARAGISFVNVAIPDRSVPPDTNAFLCSVDQLATHVREGRHLAVHCRASIGRSSVLAASIMVATLKYGEKRKLEDFLGMNIGYVLSFSDRTFREFVFDSLGMDIDEPNMGGSGSKARRLRYF
jgi:hypothetical protein